MEGDGLHGWWTMIKDGEGMIEEGACGVERVVMLMSMPVGEGNHDR